MNENGTNSKQQAAFRRETPLSVLEGKHVTHSVEPWLPDYQELEELIANRESELLAYLKSLAPRWDESRCLDLIQILNLEILENIRAGVPFVRHTLWQYVCWLARNRVIDEIRKKEVRVLEDWQAAAQTGSTADNAAESPQTVVLERERAGQKRVLLSEILQEYCRDCESDLRRLKRKEVFERSLRGQSPEQIARAKDQSMNAVYKSLSEESATLFEMLRQHPFAQSVFATLFRRKADHPLQGPKRNRPRATEHDREEFPLANASELLTWLMNEAGAMCPLPQRLQLYGKEPGNVAVADLVFHVGEARCPLCIAELARLTGKVS